MICEHGNLVSKDNKWCPYCRSIARAYYDHFKKGMKTWR